MKIASVTAVWNDERFIRAHFDMISKFDINIVLVGKKPFVDYLENGLVDSKPDRSREILEREFPHVRIFEHDFEYFCGGLFNFGMEKARELGADIIVKLDPDMLMSDDDWTRFMSQLHRDDWDTLLLDYANDTIAYKMDFDHGTKASIFPVGLDPHAVRIGESFVEEGVKIRASGRQKELRDIMVHHFTGFRKGVDEAELRRVESLQGFDGWQRCPEDIIAKFR